MSELIGFKKGIPENGSYAIVKVFPHEGVTSYTVSGYVKEYTNRILVGSESVRINSSSVYYKYLEPAEPLTGGTVGTADLDDFQELQKEVDEVNRKLHEKMDERFEDMKQKVESLERQFKGHEKYTRRSIEELFSHRRNRGDDFEVGDAVEYKSAGRPRLGFVERVYNDEIKIGIGEGAYMNIGKSEVKNKTKELRG